MGVGAGMKLLGVVVVVGEDFGGALVGVGVIRRGIALVRSRVKHWSKWLVVSDFFWALGGLFWDF